VCVSQLGNNTACPLIYTPNSYEKNTAFGFW
jgi:hypothetical protein